MQKKLLILCFGTLLFVLTFLSNGLDVNATNTTYKTKTTSKTTNVTNDETSFLYDLGQNDVKKTETKGARVFGDELSMFEQNDDETNDNPTNPLISSKFITKDDMELCGLKGTIQVEENKYLITYTSDENIIINQTSLLEEMNETMYAFSDVSIYSKLNEESEIIGKYCFNEKISVIGKFEDWYKVKYNDQYGYVKNTHISNEKVYLKRENGKTYLYSGEERIGEDLTSVNLGKFKLTAYCNCEICCGQWSAYGKTASGTTTTINRTVAVDKSLIPLGTKLLINDQNYIAEDTGSAVNDKVIDVFLGDHQKALQFGVRYREVIVYIN